MTYKVLRWRIRTELSFYCSLYYSEELRCFFVVGRVSIYWIIDFCINLRLSWVGFGMARAF